MKKRRMVILLLIVLVAIIFLFICRERPTKVTAEVMVPKRIQSGNSIHLTVVIKGNYRNFKIMRNGDRLIFNSGLIKRKWQLGWNLRWNIISTEIAYSIIPDEVDSMYNIETFKLIVEGLDGQNIIKEDTITVFSKFLI